MLRRFLGDRNGAAAAEFVLWLAVLVVPLLSAVDVGVYAFQKMQLEIAARAASQAAWHLCDQASELPAVKNCGTLSTVLTSAAQSTSLGTDVTVQAGSPVEGYYCVDNTGALQLFGSTATIGGTPTKTAASCTGTSTPPGDYLQVTTSYAYSPVFPGVSVASLLPTPITRTAWVRLK